MVRNGRVKLWQCQLTPRRLAADSGCVHAKSDLFPIVFSCTSCTTYPATTFHQRLVLSQTHQIQSNPMVHLMGRVVCSYVTGWFHWIDTLLVFWFAVSNNFILHLFAHSVPFTVISASANSFKSFCDAVWNCRQLTSTSCALLRLYVRSCKYA